MSTPGAKTLPGVYHRIISEMPPHEIYCEPFLGSGAILKNKRLAPLFNIGIDLDDLALSSFPASPAVTLIHGDALEVLSRPQSPLANERALIYADPPYPLSTRNNRHYYKHEMTDSQHADLLNMLDTAQAMVIISGYRCALYDRALKAWRRIDYKTRTRGKTVTESLWCNFPPPDELHDYRYYGDNFRQREQIKRQQARWIARLERMHPLQRAALRSALAEHDGRPGTR